MATIPSFSINANKPNVMAAVAASDQKALQSAELDQRSQQMVMEHTMRSKQLQMQAQQAQMEMAMESQRLELQRDIASREFELKKTELDFQKEQAAQLFGLKKAESEAQMRISNLTFMDAFEKYEAQKQMAKDFEQAGANRTKYMQGEGADPAVGEDAFNAGVEDAMLRYATRSGQTKEALGLIDRRRNASAKPETVDQGDVSFYRSDKNKEWSPVPGQASRNREEFDTKQQQMRISAAEKAQLNKQLYEAKKELADVDSYAQGIYKTVADKDGNVSPEKVRRLSANQQGALEKYLKKKALVDELKAMLEGLGGSSNTSTNTGRGIKKSKYTVELVSP